MRWGRARRLWPSCPRAGESVCALGARLKTKAESALSPFLPTFPALSVPRQMHDLLFAIVDANISFVYIF